MTATEVRAHPPGEYPVVVVGSGPGALQVSYDLRRVGIAHAVISADDRPGGMFLKWPFFQRLLSWTKPYTPAPKGSRAALRWDWNSLLVDEPNVRSLQIEFMDGSSDFPSRQEMEQNLAAYAARTGLPIRYGSRWTGTRREEGPDGERFVLETTDGEYRCRAAIFAVGVAQPYTPPFPGMELAAHYADTRAAESYAGKRLFIIGKQNSGFELASGLAQWANDITLASPSPAKTSINTRSLVGVRARYLQPFEDHYLGLGVKIMEASMIGVEQAGDHLLVRTRSTATGDEVALEVDEVIAATGFTCPLLDLPQLGVTTFGQARLPSQTPHWESTAVPGIYFAGTISQGAPGLKKHGIPGYSGAIQGHRFNSRILVRNIAESRFGVHFDRPIIAPADFLDLALRELVSAPELWHQKAYLARLFTVDPSGGIRDEGVQPLAWVVDGDGPDSIALTIEADGAGSIYPVVYIRTDGRIEEHVLDPHPLLEFDGPAHRRQLAGILEPLIPGIGTG